MARFPIRFDRWFSILSSALLMGPADSYIEVDEATVTCRMGWGFRASFPRSAVAGTSRHTGWTLSRGVHGFGGRWLVNGAGDNILAIELNPEQRAAVLGFPVRLRLLLVSVNDPQGLADQLA